MNPKASLHLDLRWLCALLLTVIAGMLLIWRPWTGSQKTVAVTGQATLSRTPDLFTFSPTYQKKAADTTAAIAAVSEVGNGVVAKLKELGVTEANLKTSVSSSPAIPVSDAPVFKGGSSEASATYAITAKTPDKEIAKKIQAYLATTPVLYAVSPYSDFSEATKTAIEMEARKQALENAKTKAAQTAAALGMRLGRATSVSDLNQIGGPIFLSGKGIAEPARDSASSTGVSAPDFQVGTNEFSFSVAVTYQLR